MTSDDRLEDSELERLGIRRVERHVFQWGGYTYTNVRDAISAAKREAGK